MKTMDLERFDALETIDPRPLAPWGPPIFEEINIESDRDKASEKATALLVRPSMVIYSDASANQSHLGAAAVMLDQDQKIIESRQISIGSTKHWSIHAAELTGIYYAIGLISNQVPGRQCLTDLHIRP
jgi:hypothetical protein